MQPVVGLGAGSSAPFDMKMQNGWNGWVGVLAYGLSFDHMICDVSFFDYLLGWVLDNYFD